jgi:hypothetical protein
MRSGSLLLTQFDVAFGVRAHTAQFYELNSKTSVATVQNPSHTSGGHSCNSWIRKKPELHNLHYFNMV